MRATPPITTEGSTDPALWDYRGLGALGRGSGFLSRMSGWGWESYGYGLELGYLEPCLKQTYGVCTALMCGISRMQRPPKRQLQEALVAGFRGYFVDVLIRPWIGIPLPR